IIGLEQAFNNRLSINIIKSMRNNQLNRNLTDKEIRDMLNGIEQILDRQSVKFSFNKRDNFPRVRM
ncbi:unnamed protein product, partial [Rotaria magnacalcarata]